MWISPPDQAAVPALFSVRVSKVPPVIAIPPLAVRLPFPPRVPPFQVNIPLTLRFPGPVRMPLAERLKALEIVEAPDGLSVVDAPKSDREPPESAVAAWLCRLLTVSVFEPEWLTVMFAELMTASSVAVGARLASQFPGVSQSPPAALVQVTVEGTGRSSSTSTKNGRALFLLPPARPRLRPAR